jgi:hypothetical protein
MKKLNTLEPKDSIHNMSDNEKKSAAIERHRYNYSVMFLCICNCCSNVECNSNEEGRNGRNVWNLCYTAGKPWTESINQSIGCQIYKTNTNYDYFNVSQQVFLRYRIADDFVYVVMKRQLCVESRLSALSAANLTSNGLIDRFGPWLPGCITQIPDVSAITAFFIGITFNTS